ncbi:MAG: isopentenyl pyrophosphate isomerase [Pelotomaculum sp. PtaU1.Bin035]|nr:MAG: isopentenyl pyrophosphate isomerase [Pelotomaculum sp. PtaU1.Bin035]
MFNIILRQQRKLDQIEHALKIKKPEVTSGFEDIRLINDSLPGLNLDNIDTTCFF